MNRFKHACAVSVKTILCASMITIAAAQESPLPDAPPPDLPPREAALDTLFSIPATLAELQAALENASAQGVAPQARLEARFLFHVQHNDEDGIVALLPELEKISATFTLDDTEIFSTKEDFLAVIEFARAIKSLKEKNNEAFKKHITEALWLSPNQASAFTPYIEKMRLAEHVKSTTFSFDVQLPALSDAKPSHLRVLTGEKAATLIHFWSPWSDECETATTDLSTLNPELLSHNVALLNVLVSDKSEIVAEAKDFLAGQDPPLVGAQLVDRAKDRIAAKLRVTDIPTAVLLSPEGKILFHGRPGDAALTTSLKSLPEKKAE